MTEVLIRPAVAADIPAITAIYADAVLYGTASYELTPPDEAEMAHRFEGLVNQSYPYFVGETADGALLGYAYAGPFRTRPAYRWIVEDSVYLAPQAQGKGVGRKLLTHLIAVCRDKGFRQMIAVIGGSDHIASIRLHERTGFEPIGIMRNSGFKHGRWLDTVLMQLSLGEGGATPPDETVYPGTLFKG
ncbi:GNAT family N-acetyltransferase [Consotaella salsifontis]|uniref:Phosphinothricin acetyltransferase n=1 Tax=Consotaella salsifontis TaxID=1365950 RepID=A0A1T4RYQ4_9HYPH|nr:GNAT family N-acetyltransferase [Consotaella salsifontis]SKA21144.1 phosphinothricin acetyltransferase [Consotaella salsifontis]